jgi:GT2 family glycosyltransferase
MLSIITCIHNQMPMNRLFMEALMKHTASSFELIVVDNASSDGSADFFEAAGAVVIRNAANMAYPVAQNQGLAVATGEYVAFLNNDVVVSRHWDRQLMELMEAKGLDIISPASIDRMQSFQAEQKIRRRWKRIKTYTHLFGVSHWALRLRMQWMYGSWNGYCARRKLDFEDLLVEGFSGHSFLFSKKGVELLGRWDERILEADFDLYFRTWERAQSMGDVKPIYLAAGVFVHHYSRLTMGQRPPAWQATEPIISLEEKWGKEYVQAKIARIREYREFRG